ncbi:MAG: DUF4139 domain-containing protein [Flavobacteriales bacterium]
MHKLLKITPVLLLFLHQFDTTAQNREVPLKSKIEAVTVFLKGAEVKRKAVKTVNPGVTLLVFKDLSPGIDPATVQVKARGAVTILSVSHRLNYLTEDQKPMRVKALEDSLKSIERKIKKNNNYLEALREEKALILSNKSIKGDNNGLDVEELEYTADFFRERLPEIMDLTLKTGEKNLKLQERKQKISKQLNEMQAKWMKASSEVVLELSANTKATGRFELSYLVYNAGWHPSYDLRALDVNSPVKLFYKANVYQNTGVDWSKIQLTLSTGTPVANNSKPQMQPWVLTFNQPPPAGIRSYELSNVALERKIAAKPSADKGYGEEEPYLPDAITTADLTGVQRNQVNTTFEIQVPYSVPADNKKHTVDILDAELPAIYRYYTAPKVEQAAFLLAHVTGWDDLNLLSGQANLYFEGTYIGQSRINANTTKDTLDLSFGRDASVVVSRKKIRNYTKKKVIGANKKVTIGIEISVRNTKGLPIEMDMQDQIPISSNKDIAIELLDKAGAKLDEKNGFLNWKIKVEPSENKTFVFKYAVTFPKNKVIYNF